MHNRDQHDFEEIPEHERRMLRQTLLDGQTYERILARAKAEGLLEKPHLVTQLLARLKSMVPGPVVGSAVAALAFMVLVLNPGILVEKLTPTEPLVSRQMPVHLIIYTANPGERAQAVQAIHRAFEHLEISPRSYERGTSQVFQLHATRPTLHALTDQLRQYTLPLPPEQEPAGYLRPWARNVLRYVGLLRWPQHLAWLEVIQTSQN